MKRLEKILIVLSIISLIMMFNQYQGSTWMLMISLTLLACIYFPLGFLFFSQIGVRQLFKGALRNAKAVNLLSAFFVGLGVSNLCMGILFRFLHFPGGNEMLIAGLAIAVIMLIVTIIRYYKTRNAEITLSISRLAAFSIASLALLFTSSRTLLSIQYRNYPRYVDAYLKYMDNPTPETARERDLEHYRMILTPEEFKRYEESRMSR